MAAASAVRHPRTAAFARDDRTSTFMRWPTRTMAAQEWGTTGEPSVTYWKKPGIPEVASLSVCRYQGVVAWYGTPRCRAASDVPPCAVLSSCACSCCCWAVLCSPPTPPPERAINPFPLQQQPFQAPAFLATTVNLPRCCWRSLPSSSCSTLPYCHCCLPHWCNHPVPSLSHTCHRV
jgi:hypothetical protein